MIEKRKFTRIKFSSSGVMAFKDKYYNLTVQDISLRGIRISSPYIDQIPLNSKLSFIIKNAELRMAAQGTSVSKNNDGTLGVKWTGIGEGSLNNLILLMKNLAPNKNVIEKEISGLVLKVKA